MTYLLVLEMGQDMVGMARGDGGREEEEEEESGDRWVIGEVRAKGSGRSHDATGSRWFAIPKQESELYSSRSPVSVVGMS